MDNVKCSECGHTFKTYTTEELKAMPKWQAAQVAVQLMKGEIQEITKAHKFPNLEALADGCVSTDLENWPKLKAEARSVLEENKRLKDKIVFQAGYQTSEEIKIRWKNKELQKQLAHETQCYTDHIRRSARQCQDFENRAKAAEAQVMTLKKAIHQVVLDIIECKG